MKVFIRPLLICSLISFSIPALAQCKYDQQKMWSCFNQKKDEILESKTDATDIKFALSTRPDGFTNILVTYKKGNDTFMDVVYVGVPSCASLAIIHQEKLFDNIVDHAKKVKEVAPSCIVPEEWGSGGLQQQDFLFPVGWGTSPHATVAKVGNLVVDLGTWVDTDGQTVAVFRPVKCSGRNFSVFGQPLITRSSAEISGLECNDYGCDLK